MQINVREAAKILNVSEKTIYRWIKEETIPAYRLNEQYRFNRAEILEWATSRKIEVSNEIIEAGNGSNESNPVLSEVLQSGGIIYRLSGRNKDEILKSVVDNMHLPEGVDRENLFRVLVARENLASTGIGDGIALPHVRSPIVLHVEKPIVTLCFLEKPVDFGALDGHPVDCLFVLISPTIRAHLHLLSRLGFALRDPDFKRVVKSKGLREDIFTELRRVEANFISQPGLRSS